MFTLKDHTKTETVTKVNEILENKYNKALLRNTYDANHIINEIAFPVSKQTLYYSGCPAVNDACDLLTVPGKQVIVRQDNQKVVGLVSEKYELFTHKEIFEPIIESLESMDYRFKNPAMGNNGGSVMLDAISPHAVNVNIAGQKETLFPRMLITNSYDYSAPVSIQFGFYREVCRNGMIAPAAMKLGLSVRHNAAAKYKLRDWQERINQNGWITSYRESLDQLDATITDYEALQLLTKVFKADPEKPLENRNVKTAIFNSKFGDGQNGKLTKWAIYNGVTQLIRDSENKATEKNILSRKTMGGERIQQTHSLLLAV